MYEDADESGMYDDAEEDVEVLTTAVVVDAGADGTHHSPIQHIETHAAWLTVRATNPVGRDGETSHQCAFYLQVTPDLQTVCVMMMTPLLKGQNQQQQLPMRTPQKRYAACTARCAVLLSTFAFFSPH